MGGEAEKGIRPSPFLTRDPLFVPVDNFFAKSGSRGNLPLIRGEVRRGVVGIWLELYL